MRILVLNPPYFPKFSRPQRSPAVTKSGTLYYPIWLAYATGVLEEAGFEVTFLDAPAAGLSLEAVLERARAEQPALMILDTSTPSIANDLEAARQLKELVPTAMLCLVGVHVSALPEETLHQAPWVDAVARREYEYTVRELAQAVQAAGGRPAAEVLQGIQGLTVRLEPEGAAIFAAPDRPYIEDLDALPRVSRVYRKHLRLEDYFNPNALHPMVTLTTSRGCPFRCSFCVYPQTLTGHVVRTRSIANVLDEVEEILRECPQIRSIFFEDDTLTANRSRSLEFAQAIQDRGLRFSWSANARMDLDLETMRALKAAGCRMLCVGFESGVPSTLACMRKGLGADRARQFMADARTAGLRIHGCFIIGFPGEDRAAVEQTIQLALDLNTDTAQFYPVMVYPGTQAYAMYQEKGWITTGDFTAWLTPQGLHNCVTRNEHFSPEELVALCDQARRRFYFRPGFLFRKAIEALRDPDERHRTLKAGRVFLKHLLFGSGAGSGGAPEPLQPREDAAPSLAASVIIPAYNAAASLPHTLRSLVRQKFPRESFEIIVVDDGSTDDTAARCKPWVDAGTVRWLQHLDGRNHGPAAARNLGAQHARGEVVVFTDADCRPEPEFLANILEKFGNPSVDAAQGAYRTLQRQLTARFAQAEFESRYALHEDGGPVDLVATYAAAFRRAVFLEAGGFDVSYPTANNEDTEFSYRLLALGKRLVFAPGALVRHLHPASLWQYCRTKFWRAYWRIKVYRRHPEKAVSDQYTSKTVKYQTLAGMLAWALLLAGLLWPGLLWGAAAVAVGIAASAVPWALQVLRFDALLALALPGFVVLRAMALAAGTGWGLLMGWRKH
ncbi:glycosyltransferase [Megalodesulfovibrio paquesii]